MLIGSKELLKTSLLPNFNINLELNGTFEVIMINRGSRVASAQQDEETKYLRLKLSKPFYTKYALEQDERRALVQDVKLTGLALFEYYLRMASIENVVLSDSDASAYFGIPAGTLKKYRRALTKTGWILFEKTRMPSGRVIHIYHLGKEEVATARLSASRVVGHITALARRSP